MKDLRKRVERKIKVIEDMCTEVGEARGHSSALAKADVFCDVFTHLNQNERTVFKATCMSRGLKVEVLQ